jgi:hypothetical protein
VALTNPLRVRTVVPTRQGPPAPKAVARAKKAGGNEAAIGAWLMHRPGGLPKPPPRPTVAPVAPQRAAGWNPEPVDPTQSLIDKAIAALANSPDPFAQAGPLVQQIIDAENAQAKLAYDQRVAQAQADAQRITGIYSGAATALNALGLPAQAQGAYQGAAHEQTAFAKGYSDGMQKALGKSASKTNSDLAAVGAPQGQMIDPKQATKAGDVLYGLGGAIPGTLLSQQGLSASDSLTGIPAAMIGSGAFYASGNLAQAQKEASDWYAGQLANIAADQPKTLIDLANFYAGQNTQAQNRASSLISAASRTTPVAKPKPYQHVTIGGKAYGFDPNTGRFLDPATGRVVRPVAKAGLGAPPRVNMPLSRSLGRWVDSAGKPIPSLTHVAPADRNERTEACRGQVGRNGEDGHHRRRWCAADELADQRRRRHCPPDRSGRTEAREAAGGLDPAASPGGRPGADHPADRPEDVRSGDNGAAAIHDCGPVAQHRGVARLPADRCSEQVCARAVDHAALSSPKR